MRQLGLIGAVLLLGAAPPARVVTGDGVVAATLNGVSVRVRIDPGATAMPSFSAEAATRAGLKGGMFGVRYRIGPTSIGGHTAVATLVLPGAELKRRVAWFDRAPAPGIDGAVGPAGLDEPVVRFTLAPAQTGERSGVLDLSPAHWDASWARLALPDGPIAVRFDPHSPTSTVTAAAAVRLATLYGGRLEGPATQAMIAYGIARPVRLMRLARPMPLGPLQVDRIAVRVGDSGSAATIADADADPAEIVVQGGKNRHDHDRITLGADLLARCSSLVFDKPAKLVRLTCA